MKLEERTEVKMWLVDKISLKNSKLKKKQPSYTSIEYMLKVL